MGPWPVATPIRAYYYVLGSVQRVVHNCGQDNATLGQNSGAGYQSNYPSLGESGPYQPRQQVERNNPIKPQSRELCHPA